MSDLSERHIGPWTLHVRRGRGGNATVWTATRADAPSPVALKLINTTKVEKESYQRFVREIRFLGEHPSDPGVLPLIDAYLPDQPSGTDPPWLAMPVATPIADALQGKSLAEVVVAVARPWTSTSCSSRVVSTCSLFASWPTMRCTTSSYSSPGAVDVGLWLPAVTDLPLKRAAISETTTEQRVPASSAASQRVR